MQHVLIKKPIWDLCSPTSTFNIWKWHITKTGQCVIRLARCFESASSKLSAAGQVGYIEIYSVKKMTWCGDIVTVVTVHPALRHIGKQNTRGNVSKISVNLRCYRYIGSKFTNQSPLAWCKEGQNVTLVAVIGGFRSDLSITRKTEGNSASVLFSKVAYQRKRW